jgi:putative ABC transport system permease protein
MGVPGADEGHAASSGGLNLSGEGHGDGGLAAAGGGNRRPLAVVLESSVRAISDNFRLAFSTFWGHRLRSLLTLLGIVIGAATVVSMMALLEGLRKKVDDDLTGLGANGFQIQKFPNGFGNFDFEKLSKRPNLTIDDRDDIERRLPNVIAVTGEAWDFGVKVSTDRYETRPTNQVAGGTADFFATNAMDIASGRSFNVSEVADGERLIVLGSNVADVLFPQGDPLGQTVRIRTRPFRVIGLIKRKGAFAGGFQQDDVVVIPISAFFQLWGKARSLNISMQAASAELLPRAMEEVRNLMRRRHNLKPTQEDDFYIFSNESATQAFNQIASVTTAASFGVCLLSLIVGGIGILNIMLVSVTERTAEIGVRKALGARRRRILGQFATEAVVLSLFGGILGVMVGAFIAFLGRWALGFPTAVPAWAVALAMLMSSGVGLIFGIYPAARAARLDPVDAMRTE